MTYTIFHRLSASSRHFGLLLAAIGISATAAQAQTQLFNSLTPQPSELGFSGTGSYFTMNGTLGVGAYGAGTTTVTTATIDFAERTIATGATGSTLKFDVANPAGNYTTASRVQVYTRHEVNCE